MARRPVRRSAGPTAAPLWSSGAGFLFWLWLWLWRRVYRLCVVGFDRGHGDEPVCVGQLQCSVNALNRRGVVAGDDDLQPVDVLGCSRRRLAYILRSRSRSTPSWPTLLLMPSMMRRLGKGMSWSLGATCWCARTWATSTSTSTPCRLQVSEGTAVHDRQIRLLVDAGAWLVVEAGCVETAEGGFECAVEFPQAFADRGRMWWRPLG